MRANLNHPRRLKGQTNSRRTKRRTEDGGKIEKIVGAIIVLAIFAQVQLFYHLNIGVNDVGVNVDVDDGKKPLTTPQSGTGNQYHGIQKHRKPVAGTVTENVGKGKNGVVAAAPAGTKISNSTGSTSNSDQDNKIVKDQDGRNRNSSDKADKNANDNGNGNQDQGRVVPTPTPTITPIATPNFKKYDKVAIVSKIHHPEDIFRVKKMLCFCTAAYNQYVNYDVVIFMTMPFTEEHVEDLREAVAPSNLIVARDGPTLEEHLASMTEDEKNFLLDRCDVKRDGSNSSGKYDKLTWYSHCKERDSDNISNLAYSWQSEFRAYHIYRHEALMKYKYMVWFDSDAQCVEPWKVDPVETMVQNDLAILFYNFPQGRAKNNLIRPKMKNVYGREICGLKYDKHLIPSYCRTRKENVKIAQIHGFHHITNLDFYRNETQLELLKEMVSEYKFSRMWDDQIGVTLPAALGAPKKSWSYHDHGLHSITILHKEKPVLNNPGRIRNNKYDLRKYWYEEGGREKLPGGEKCDAFLTMH